MRKSDIYKTLDPLDPNLYWEIGRKLGIAPVHPNGPVRRAYAYEDYRKWLKNPFEYEIREMMNED